ncbi:MAG: tetratricopeptide repeat protein [Opitutales bacterium]|nr:tetratricopeptide repeat protein [Opitutales bacterium]MBP3359028.1 tetratricopeptide repeat protein [Opitutales bacterium]MBQ2722451.1 tetratricopeptide repeat protein [Opitutales bacterium]
MILIKKIFCTISLMLIFSAISAVQLQAQTAHEFFMLGNNAYKSGDYKKAVECYESAIEQKFDSAELHYNLANALSKLDKKGEALLNYKRAIFNSPRMREAVANLQMFAKDNSLDDGFGNFATPLIAELSDTEWTTIAFIAFWGAVLMFFIPPLFARRTTATTFIVILFVAIFAVSVFSISNWKAYENSAVSIKQDVPLRLSPTPDAPISSIIAEGQTASIEARHGDYIYVETQNGKRGWSSIKDFIPIVQ